MAIKASALGGLGLALLLAGCGNPERRMAERQAEAQEKVCPERQVAAVSATRDMIELLQPGLTPTATLREFQRPMARKMLHLPGQDDLLVDFYPLTVPGCPWMLEAAGQLPVVYEPNRRHGVVLGYGVEVLKTLQRQGWRLGEWRRDRALGQVFVDTPWPWQSWNFAYIPID